jgi:hypothetical protein
MLLPLGVVLTVSTIFFLVLAVLDLLRIVPRLDPATAAGEEGSCPRWPAGVLTPLADAHLLRRAPVRTWPRALSRHVRAGSSATCPLAAGSRAFKAGPGGCFGV